MELVFSPHHFIDYIHISLNDANHLHGHSLIHIVGAGLTQDPLLLHLDCHIGGVKQLPRGDASQNKVPGFQCLGALGGGADTHSSDRMTNRQIEAAFLWQGTGVGNDCKSVHLQLVVVVEAQRLIDPDTRVKFKAALFQTVLAARMTGVQKTPFPTCEPF